MAGLGGGPEEEGSRGPHGRTLEGDSKELGLPLNAEGLWSLPGGG